MGIVRIAGPVVVGDVEGASLGDMVRIGEAKLIGEIIGLRGEQATIQAFEDTNGLGIGEPIESTHFPVSVELGPGLIGSIYDGIQRPLDTIKMISGDFVPRGITIPSLDRDKKWHFEPRAKKGDKVSKGQVVGTVKETELIEHRIMALYDGIMDEVREGDFTVEESVAIISGKEMNMIQRWPVRMGRPYGEKIPSYEPLVTGQRVLDTFFPIARGGAACVSGPFGSGKTVVQHQLARWSDADVIIFVGCGERGNEMCQVLLEFPELTDPRTGRPLMERTILIANTSNMPFAAREASVYTGITLAEYYRDMGYNVALQADSTSRWAEALREISGRLEEMPGEEGYPAYLASRIAAFYERSGVVKTLGGGEGSITVIGSVSPPGGDFSEPVTQATLRFTKVFWALDAQLAYMRHFPAVNWLNSYSLYIDDVESWWEENVSKDWRELRDRAMALLQRESELQEIVKLIGTESLSDEEKLILEVSRHIREDFLYQSAFHEIDTFTDTMKQYRLLRSIMYFYDLAKEKITDAGLEIILKLPIRAKISRAKYLTDMAGFDQIDEEIKKSLEGEDG